MDARLWKVAFAAMAVARLVTSQSPPGFEPPVENALTVVYSGQSPVSAGQTEPAGTPALSNPPSLAVGNAGTASHVVIMMDLSIQLASLPGAAPNITGNTTALHWILPGLAASNTTARAAVTGLASTASVIAPYINPQPPAGQSHTYTLFLYDEPSNFTVPADYTAYFANLTASPLNRVGFNMTKFTDESGLGSPVAANWFLVSNFSSSTPSTTASTTLSPTSVPTSPASSIRSHSSPVAVGAVLCVWLLLMLFTL